MKKSLVMLLTFTLLLTSTPFALAQTAEPSPTKDAPDWRGVFILKPGEKVLVELKNGRKGEGEVIGVTSKTLTMDVTSDKLSLSPKNHTYTFEQPGIQRVYGFKGKGRSKAAKIGAVIGILTGTFIGAGIAVRNESRPGHLGSEKDTLPAFLGFFIGGAAGAGVGSLFGSRGKKVLLYEAK